MPNPLPLSTILNVSVFVSPAAAPGPTFNQALIVGPSTVIPSLGDNSRLRLYYSLDELVADGFSTTSPEYLAASVYFGQTPQPTYLWIGRQDLTAIGTAVVGSSAGTGYAVGDVLSVVQTGGSGGKLKVVAIGAGGAVTSVALLPGAQGTGYSVATGLSTTGGSGTGCTVNVSAIGESPLQSVQACRASAPNWYACTFVGTALDADHQAIAGYIESASPAAVYFLTTGATGVLNAAPNNLLAEMQSASYRRTFSVYSTTQGGVYASNTYAAAAAMGMAMGRNTGAAGSYFELMFKPIAVVTAEPLSQTQVNAIAGTVDRSNAGLNGNLILNFQNGATWLQPGVMASGDFFDEVLNIDMLASDMQTGGVNLLTSVPALPITDGGVTQMKSVIAAACDRAQARGFIAPSGTWQGAAVGTGANSVASGTPLPKGYYIYAPPVISMSSAQRAARIMPPVTVLFIEAQSGHSLSVTVEVQR